MNRLGPLCKLASQYSLFLVVVLAAAHRAASQRIYSVVVNGFA